MQHTPIPWEVDATARTAYPETKNRDGSLTFPDGYRTTGYSIRSKEHKGILVADIYPGHSSDRSAPVCEANAAFIVTACNAHEELLAALGGLVNNAGLTWLPGYKEELDTAMRQARAAIAKAEGK